MITAHFFFLRGSLQTFCRQMNGLKLMGPDTCNFRPTPTLNPRTFAISLTKNHQTVLFKSVGVPLRLHVSHSFCYPVFTLLRSIV